MAPVWFKWCTYVIDTNQPPTETAWIWRQTSRNWTFSLPRLTNEFARSLNASDRCYSPKSLAWNPSQLKIKSTKTCKSSMKGFCLCSITNLKTSFTSVDQSSQATTCKSSAKSIQLRYLRRSSSQINCKSVQIWWAGLTVSRLYLRFKKLSKGSQFRRENSLKKVYKLLNKLNSNDLR